MVREMKYFLTHLTIQFLDILTADEDGGDGGGTHEDENDESMEYEQNPDCRTRVANESSKENDDENLMKDLITVECNKINGKLFNGTVNFSEAKTKIFRDGLGLDANLLSTVQIKFNKYPIITFKLKSKINVALDICMKLAKVSF